jgi:hypothetical protein
MSNRTRRDFLAEVGKGMLVAGLGPGLATELGLSRTFADDGDGKLSFGKMEPLVALLQETPADKVLPILVDRLRGGTGLRELVAASALANARTFGGSHYEGFHAFMALAPAYHMAGELPKERQPLPVLKVLYRNATFMERVGGRRQEKLHPLKPAPLSDRDASCKEMRGAIRAGDVKRTEQAFAALAGQPVENAFDDLLRFCVEDEPGVHEVVLAWRAWEMLNIVGKEHAHTLLRQSVRQNTAEAKKPKAAPPDPPASLVVTLLDRHGLGKKPLGKRAADDAWVDRMIATILASKPAQAAEAVAAALAEGFSPEHVGEAIALAANQLVLRQVENWEGVFDRRTHGASMGVHASDAVNAWRNVARVGSVRNRAASLILAAGYVPQGHRWSEDRRWRGHEREPYPSKQHLEQVKTTEPEALLRELDGAIRENDQFRACAVVQRYGEAGHPARAVFDLLLGYAVSEDGSLHGEKYYRTVSEEFAATRPAFRWRQLVALARVTASAFGFNREDQRGGDGGYRAPGYEEACRLLRV